MNNYLKIVNALIELAPDLRIVKLLDNGFVIESEENGESTRFMFVGNELIIDEPEYEEDED